MHIFANSDRQSVLNRTIWRGQAEELMRRLDENTDGRVALSELEAALQSEAWATQAEVRVCT